MAQQYQYVCDGCGATVHGKDRNAFIHEDYIQFNNVTMVLQMMDPQTRYKSHLYLTRQPSEDLTFCMKPGMPCLEQFMQAKKNGAEARRKEYLMQEASDQRINRLANY